MIPWGREAALFFMVLGKGDARMDPRRMREAFVPPLGATYHRGESHCLAVSLTGTNHFH